MPHPVSTLPAGLSDTLARHVAETPFDSLPATTVAATKRALLDGIGVMLAASGVSADVRPFVETARSIGGPPVATILGFGDRVGAPAAAFANGAMAHALDYEDAFDAAPTHPNASLIPAALAIAQSRGTIGGKDFIAAMAIGCDLVCRLALSVGDGLEHGNWYPPPILGAFGAVAAASRLMNLTAEQTRDAFSLLLCQNVCPGEIKYSRGTILRAVREAFPAQAAVLSVTLAALGTKGFEQPLEGRAGFFQLFAAGRCDSHVLLKDLGKQFWIEQLSLKPWPCCRGTHAYVECAQVLRERHSFGWQDIASIRAPIGEVQRMLVEPLERKRAPVTAIDAKFSIPFTVAAAFVHPEVTLDTFSPQGLREPRVLELATRVDAEPRADWGRERAAAGALLVSLKDGRHLTHEIDEALGHPTRPLDETRLRKKFFDCARRAARPLSGGEALDLCERILSLDTASRVGRALDPLHGA